MKRHFAAWVLMLMLSAHAQASPLSASKAADMQTALDDLSLALANHGYKLVKVQPIDQALVKRGYADPGIRLAFVGKDELVRQAMTADSSLLNLLPLRLTVRIDEGQVRISSDDLSAWRERMPHTAPVLKTWEGELAAILTDFANQ